MKLRAIFIVKKEKTMKEKVLQEITEKKQNPQDSVSKSV